MTLRAGHKEARPEGRTFHYRPELDGLRGIAILLVMASHAKVLGINEGGEAGVTAFFVLSGYLITGLLLAERERSGRIDLGAFYVRRVARLAPALVALLVFVAIVGLAVGWPADWRLGIATSAFYVSNWLAVLNININPLGHTWSLAIEEQFYLLWPAALIVLGTRRAAILAVAGLAVAAVGRSLGTGEFEYFSTVTRGDAILAGCLVAIAGVRLPSWFGLVGLVGLVLIAWTNWPYQLAFPAATAAAALVVAAPWSPLAVLGAIGRRAYGLYLWDWPLTLLLGPLLAIPATFLVAASSYRYLEQPIRSWVRSGYSRRSAPTTRMSDLSAAAD